MHWYTLIDTARVTNDYYTPIGDQTGPTAVWLYNPNAGQISVQYDFLGGSTPNGQVTLNTGQALLSPTVPNDSGARFYTTNSADVFYALAQIDTGGTSGDSTGGQIYDWGYTLVPASQLSPQVLVGMGLGCTTDCGSGQSRSVVWVTPVSGPTTIYVNFDGSGINCAGNPATDADLVFTNVSALASKTIRDASDENMTGATILTCNGTNIAAAWGQDPARSFSGDDEALDMGSSIPPLPNISFKKRPLSE